MKTIMTLFTITLAFTLIGCQNETPPDVSSAAERNAISAALETKKAANKAVVEKFFNGTFHQSDVAMSAEAMGEIYIQHNPRVTSGPQNVLDYIPALKAHGFWLKTHRMFADENYVVTHNEVHNVPIPGWEKVITFDVYRIYEGTLEEHWDNVITNFEKENASGHTQVDGFTEVLDIEKTEENKALVVGYVNDILIGDNISNIGTYISKDTFTQHNPDLEDGITSLTATLNSPNIESTYGNFEKLHLSVGEGNFVFTMLEGTRAGKRTAFFKLYRVADGKIVEQWDVIEEIPDNFVHDNGKF